MTITVHRPAFRPLLCLAVLSTAFVLCACGEADDAGSDEGGDSAGDEDSGGNNPDPGPAPTVEAQACDAAANRIDPAAARGMTNEQFAALGAARSGLAGAGTTQDNAEVRYVSGAAGDDAADGSEDAPWQTLQHAADTVAPGTTVLVDASAPYTGGLDLHRDGAEGAYIVFRNRAAGEMPLVLGGPERESVVDISASYVVFQGFEIADHQSGSLEDDTIGIQIEPRADHISHVEVRNNIIHNVGPGQIDQDSCYYNGHGIIAQAEGLQLSNLVIDGNELYDQYVGNSEVLVVNGNIDGFCVTNNYVHDVNNIAIDIIGYEKNDTETARNGVIADNIVLDASNYWPYCSRGNCTYPAGDESSDGIYVDGGANLDIAYNVVGRADHGIELQSENGQLIRDVEVRSNLVFNSNYKNFTLGDAENSVEYDNVFFDDATLVDPDLEACK